MNLRNLCIIMGIICITGAMPAQGQGPKTGEMEARLSGPVCEAVEQYIASVSAIASLDDKTRREKGYDEAYKTLQSVFKNKDNNVILDEASTYARTSELVTVGDPTNKGFGDLLETRAKSAAKLLGMCASYTLSR